MIKNEQKTVIFICGPTAAGKTNLAVSVAKHFNTEIISADSRQIYKEISIGTAVPEHNLQKEIKHHLIQHISIFDKYSVADFERESMRIIEQIFRKKNIVIVAGGTGLYLSALENGLDDLPETNEEVRSRIQKLYDKYGIKFLQKFIYLFDRETFQKLDLQNYRRLMRAVEIIVITGKPASLLRSGIKKSRPFRIIKIGIFPGREILINNINKRVELMIKEGLEAEVKSFLHLKNLQAFQTVGYKEWWDYFDGNKLISEVVEQIKVNTRQYAKRQMTWFKKDSTIKWFESNDEIEIINYLELNLDK